MKLSAPKNTEMNHSEVAEDKLKGMQKAKQDEERFIQELFLFLQKQHESMLNQEFDIEKPLNEIATDCGYQDIQTALNTAKNARGQSPLTQALQDQDFSLSRTLINSGAEYDPKSLAEFDIAIHSQRGQKALQDKTISIPENYKSSEKLHTVTEFGLTLGIDIISKDGTPSQRAHVAPTYQLMTDTVKDYSKDCPKEPAKSDFKEISEAFAFANKAAKFECSTPEGSPEAGKALSQRIKDGEMTSVPINCKGHAMGLSFVPVEGNPDKTYLVFTNRGEGATSDKIGTQVYEVDTKDVTPDFINKVMSGHDQGLSHAEVMKQIDQVTKGKDPVSTIEQKPQKYDNCTVANTRANIHGVLLCQEANRKGGFENVDQQTKNDVKERYKDFTDDMRGKKVQQLEKALKSDPNNPDLINLAKAYVESKPDSKFSDTLRSAVAEHSQKESISMSSM